MVVCADHIYAQDLISIKGLTEGNMGKIMSGFGLGVIIWGIMGP